MRGKKNPNWKKHQNEKISLRALHGWIRRRKPKPSLCVHCHLRPAVDLANISQEYKQNVNDFEWLCRKCHMQKDGRLLKLLIHSFKNHVPASAIWMKLPV